MTDKRPQSDAPESPSRRRLLRNASGAALVLGTPAIVHAVGDSYGSDLFSLGVASGDPGARSVQLWTRLAPDPLNGGGLEARFVPVDIEVALDPGFAHLVRRGRRFARARDGHVINLRVAGLPPDTRLYYRFKALGETSRVGITRTFPRFFDSPEQVRFAVVSCQNYTQGYYTAYRDIALQDVDFVIHTGDYIYEGGGGSDFDPARNHSGPEIFSVEDYRNRYAQYRLDPDLQEAHAQAPFLVTWDDHEVENNYAGAIDEDGEADEANSAVGTFLARRRNAYQVYRESMPLRPFNRVLRGNDELRIFRGFSFGDLADIHMLDTRQYRTDQPAGDNFGSADETLTPVEEATLEAVFGEQLFDADGILDPDATLLGHRQEAWLARRLRRSRAQWNVLAQQVMVTRWNLAETGRLQAALLALPDPLPPEVQAALASLETLSNVDAWDGYPVARRRLLDLVDRSGARNPVVVTGDIHSSWGANLLEDFDDPASRIVAAEIVCTSIASTFLALDPRPTHEIVRRGVAQDNPWIEYFNGLWRGYALCDVDREAWTTTFRAVGDITRLGEASPLAGLVPLPDSPVETDAVLRLASGFQDSGDGLQTVASRPNAIPLPI